MDANSALDAAHQAASDAAQKVTDAQAAVDDLASKLADARTEEANARAQRPGWQLTIEGANLATAEELSAWFTAQNHLSRANAPLDDLTGWFISEGNTEGVRGDMAFAQAVVETGYFANPDTVNGNNFAGIGHCDTCPSGFVFPDVQTGVRGQIQLLKSYVEDTPTYANPLVDSRLRGPAGLLSELDGADPCVGQRPQLRPGDPRRVRADPDLCGHDPRRQRGPAPAPAPGPYRARPRHRDGVVAARRPRLAVPGGEALLQLESRLGAPTVVGVETRARPAPAGSRR